ncbi:MAG: MerR family transcriptional regulator [Nannocystis sp.]|nr:MerR family transcriptional regulator [Nannocystis sp.]
MHDRGAGVTAARSSEGIDRERYPYKMKDLCELTGLDRQAVHFYIQQGLVPEGQKTGRNMAYYGPEHVERIKLIRRLQHERFLPLKAIRAVIEGRDDSFSPEQRALLVDLRPRLHDALGGDEGGETIAAAEALAAHGVTLEELRAMANLGLLTVLEEGGRARIARQDLWLIETWGALRAAGLSRGLGFEVEDLAIYEEAVAGLLRREIAVLTPRLAHLPPDAVAELLRRALPLVAGLLVRLHQAKARDFLAALA